MHRKIIIALDGPAGSGKSTIAKLIAKELDLIYIDTGAMYRGITYLALQQGLSAEENENEITTLAEQAKFEFKDLSQTVILNGEDITNKIRTPEINANVSAISAIAPMREALVTAQRHIAEGNSSILDGRDIGTVVFPNADLKIYMIASAEVRAERRHKELLEKGQEQDYQEVLEAIIQRDKLDMERASSPLKKADNAIELDTSHLSIEKVVNKVKDLALSL